jgi:Leucine-rich repeat (LRR) protein
MPPFKIHWQQINDVKKFFMIKKRYSILLLVLISPQCIHAATDCAAVTEIPSTECDALVTLYNSTDGDDWTRNSGWLENNTPCSWYGVTCGGGQVSELSLDWNKLTGTIPSQLGNLTNLTELDLGRNSLTGTIPSQLGNLTNLEFLYLNSNGLTGTIPSQLGNLTNLEILYLSGNELTGTIPSQLGNLTNLESLYLSLNSLTGSIPSQLGNLTNLESLYLYNNSLTGSIPSQLGNLTNLTGLFLYGNSLTGSIPSQLGNLTNLTELILSWNSLTGSIPSQLGNLTNLWELWLNDNELCGEIPVELKNLSNIPLPDEIEDYLYLIKNHLTASDSELRAWLNRHNPSWERFQTPCPQQQSKLQFSSATYSVVENKGQATITVTRTNSSDGAVSVEYTTSDDTATAPDDYTQTSGTINWKDGDDTDKPITIDITDDSIKEKKETLIVSLGNPTGGAKLGKPDTAKVKIKDDDKSFNCKKAMGIPKKECKALVTFYDDTLGAKWTNNSGWKATNSPCDWYGVNCRGGKVTGLALRSNNLKGTITKTLNKLKGLKTLLLNDNKLTGKIPKTIMKLKKLKELDLNDNCLETKVSKKLKKWLKELNPGWDDTQGDCLY